MSESESEHDVVRQADEILGLLWVDLINSDLIDPRAADAFDNRREQIRALATVERTPPTPT
jgi:hypothetical protein